MNRWSIVFILVASMLNGCNPRSDELDEAYERLVEANQAYDAQELKYWEAKTSGDTELVATEYAFLLEKKNLRDEAKAQVEYVDK